MSNAALDAARRISPDWEYEVNQLLLTYARTVDEQRFVEWLDLFTDDCTYSVITYENAQDQGMYLFMDDKEGMKLRAAQLLGIWQAPRGKTLHVISNVEFGEVSEAGEVAVTTYLVVYRTAADGDTKLHSAGKTENVVVRQGD